MSEALRLEEVTYSEVDGDLRVQGVLIQPWRSCSSLLGSRIDLDHAGNPELESMRSDGMDFARDRAATTGASPREGARNTEPEGVKLAPKAVVGRVSLYLRQLETFQRQGMTTISSSQLGAPLSIKNAQVRKDLAFFGQFGHPGIGYRIDELISALRQILGIDRDWPLALVGLGNLGRALLRYRGFRTRGFQIVAVFDNDPRQDRPDP